MTVTNNAPRHGYRFAQQRLGLFEAIYGASDEDVLVMQSNLAVTCEKLGKHELALQMKRDVYSGYLKLKGKENKNTIIAANNYAHSLVEPWVRRFEEARSLMRKTMPSAGRVLGESHEITLKMRYYYTVALYKDPDATLDDLREAVTTLEETERTARRVLGGAHPTTEGIEEELQDARAKLRARETPSPGVA